MNEESLNKKSQPLFPGILLWLRLPAFISWCAISTGILASSWLTKHYKLQLFTQESLCNITTVTAIVSLFAGIIVKNTVSRFICFFIAGALFFTHYNAGKELLFIHLNTIKNDELTICGKVCSPSMPYPDNIRFLFKVDSTSLKNTFLVNKVLLCLSKDSVPQGSHLRINGTIKIPGRPGNPYEFDEYSYLMSNGLLSKFSVISVSELPDKISIPDKISSKFRSSVSEVIKKFSISDHRALLFAIFLGETEYLSSDLKASFRMSGIYHMLSISGLHAAMLIGACYFVLRFIPIPLVYHHSIALAVLWLYQCFIGFIPCLFRATIMTTAMIVAFLFQKKPYPIQAIGIGGTIWLLLSPDSLFQPGYQLSFAATFGIITIYPVLNRFIPDISNQFLRYPISSLLSPLYLSFTGLISTLPIILYYFGSFSLYSLLANLIAVPLMTVAMWLFFAAIVFTMILPPIASLVIGLCKHVFSWIIFIADLSYSISFSTLTFPAMSAGVLIIFLVILICIATIHKNHQKLLFTISIPLLLLSVAGDILIQRINTSIDITTFRIEKGSLYAIKWTDNKIWLLINCKNNQVLLRGMKTVNAWLRHQGEAPVDCILFITSSKKSQELIGLPSAKMIQFSTKGISIADSAYFELNSASHVQKYHSKFSIVSRNDTLHLAIIRKYAQVLFPVANTESGFAVQDMKSNHTDYITSPCTVHLKENKYTISYYRL